MIIVYQVCTVVKLSAQKEKPVFEEGHETPAHVKRHDYTLFFHYDLVCSLSP